MYTLFVQYIETPDWDQMLAEVNNLLLKMKQIYVFQVAGSLWKPAVGKL